MAKDDNVVIQGNKKFNKEIADAAGVKTHYCKDCDGWHASVTKDFKWDEKELKMPIAELEALIDPKAPKEEIENMAKFFKALSIRRLIPKATAKS